MSPIDGQTAGPIGLKFFVDTHGWPGGVKNTFKKNIFKQIFLRETSGPSASSNKKEMYNLL